MTYLNSARKRALENRIKAVTEGINPEIIEEDMIIEAKEEIKNG